MDENPSAGNYESLPSGMNVESGKRSPGGDPAMMKQGSEVTAATVLAWTPKHVKEWWSRSLPSGCQEYIYIVDECELDGADLMDLDYISLQQYEVKKMHIMKILRRIKQMKQSLGMNNVSATAVADGTAKTGEASDGEHRAMNDDLDPIPEGGRDPRRVKAEAENNTQLIEILENESIHPPWKVVLMFVCCGGL